MSHNMHMPMPMPNATMDGMAMMHMTFFWGKDLVMLFSDWPNGKLGMYILSLVFVFVLAVAIEFFADFPATKIGASPFVGVLVRASVYGLRMALAYVVMLAEMSYNVGVFVVVVVGHVVGFFLVKYRVALKAKNDSI